MDDLKRLVEGLQALEQDLSRCMKCGFCHNVCPVYAETMLEPDVSRGKLALLDNMAHKLLDDTSGLSNRLDRCLLCGSCEANCPSGTPVKHIFISARALIAEYKGLSPIKKLIFRTLLPNPGRFDFAMNIGASCQNFVFQKVKGSKQGTAKAPLLSPLIGNRHIMPLAKTSLHKSVGKLDTAPGKSGLKVAFFPGCMGDRMFTSMGEACIKALRHHEVGIFFPDNLACCGLPALASGDVKGFEVQLRHNLGVLDANAFDYIVTPCGSCTAAIHEMWPSMGNMSAAEREKAKAIAAKAMDINAFLANVLHVTAATPAENAVRVTYHDPCHLKKSLKVSKEPRAVMQANPAYDLVEMSESDRCCGCGGSFNLFHYDLSKKIGQHKRDSIVETKADIVATGCPACMMQITDALSQKGDKVLVKHVIELYAESLP